MESTLRHRDLQLPGWRMVHNDFGGLMYKSEWLGWVEAKVLTRYYTTIDNIDISSK